MIEWKTHMLGEMADIQTGPFGTQLHAADYVATGVPSIMPTNIGSRLNIVTEKLVFVKSEDINRLKKYIVEEGDIVYSRRGDVEKCAYISKHQTGWLCGTGCLRIRIKSNQLLPKFLAYYVSTEEIKGWISNSAVGTTMPNLNSRILNSLPLRIPSYNIQQRIASILSSLDDKIELNRQMNQTLEEMAQAMFKHYFVDGIDKDNLPDGWKMGRVGDIVYHSKQTLNPCNQPDTLFSHYSLPAYDETHLPAPELGVTILSNKGSFNSKSILYSKLNPRFPRVWSILQPKMNAVSSTEFLIFQPNDPYYSFVYCLLSSKVFIDNIVPKATGTSGSHQRIRPSDVLEETVALNESTCLQLENLVMPLLQQKEGNLNEIETLTQTRDYLLPRLISGEIIPADLKEIEQTL